MVPINRMIHSLKRAVVLVTLATVPALAQSSSGVLPVSPPGSIQPTSTWGLASLDKATNTLYVTGMRGIDPTTNKLVEAAKRVKNIATGAKLFSGTAKRVYRLS